MSKEYFLGSGVSIIKVEDGHEVFDPRSGKKLTVTDENAVVSASQAYVTQRCYDELKRHADSLPRYSTRGT